jgi:hypothetical protein
MSKLFGKINYFKWFAIFSLSMNLPSCKRSNLEEATSVSSTTANQWFYESESSFEISSPINYRYNDGSTNGKMGGWTEVPTCISSDANLTYAGSCAKFKKLKNNVNNKVKFEINSYNQPKKCLKDNGYKQIVTAENCTYDVKEEVDDPQAFDLFDRKHKKIYHWFPGGKEICLDISDTDLGPVDNMPRKLIFFNCKYDHSKNQQFNF